MAIYDSRYTRTQIDVGIGAGYVPTLQAPPTSSTTSYTRSDLPSGSQTVSFVVGQMCRVAVTGGYDFYQLKDVSGNTATWEKTNYRVMGASGSGHASGLVPDTGSTAGTTKFLREDGTWQIPESGGSVIPVVLLYEPRTPEAGMVIFDAGDTNKFYRYTMQGWWVEFSTPHKAFGVDNNDEWYEIIDGVLSQTPIADFEYNAWYIYYTGGPKYQTGQVVFIGEYHGGGMLPTLDDIINWNKPIGLPVGSETVTSLASLPVTNRMIVATISTNQSTVSISGGVSSLTAGCELHVVVKATAAVTITLPTSSQIGRASCWERV